MVLLTMTLFAASASAQGRSGGSDSAQAARQAAANKPRTIAGPMISQATYFALLYDMGNYLRSMGFKEIFYMGDSGGNGRGMQAAADSLTKVYASSPDKVSFKHIAEFYNHTSVVQPYIQNELSMPSKGRRAGRARASTRPRSPLDLRNNT